MIVLTATAIGGTQDFLYLSAESLIECRDLARVATSDFLQDKTQIGLVLHGDTVSVKVRLGPLRAANVDPATLSAMDETP